MSFETNFLLFYLILAIMGLAVAIVVAGGKTVDSPKKHSRPRQ